MSETQAPAVTPQLRKDISERFEGVVAALKEHPLWNGDPAQNHQTLYFTWEFVMRSIYMLSEYDNIKEGKPIQHFEQIKITGTGEAAALKVFQEACGRTMMIKMLVNDDTGMAAMMTGNMGPKVDYGQKVKDAVAELDKVVPEQHLMAGMMGD